MLPKVVQQTVVDDVRFIFTYFVENYQELIKYHLQNSGFVVEDNEDLQELLND